MEEYSKLNAEYLQIVWEAAKERRNTDIAWLVDASKDVYRLFFLTNSAYFNFRIIHLMKDPRAFVYSMTKDNPGISSRTIRFAGRWIVQNAQFAHLGADKKLKRNVLQLKYENLASQPYETLVQIGNWLKLDFSHTSITDFRQQENHAVSGNPMRWKNTAISLDEKWHYALPEKSKRLVWAMSGTFAKRWGYSW
jgi:hypothetical protein